MAESLTSLTLASRTRRVNYRRKKIAHSLEEVSDKSLREKIRTALESEEVHLWSSSWVPIILDQSSDNYPLYQALAAYDVLGKRYGEAYARRYVGRNVMKNSLWMENIVLGDEDKNRYKNRIAV